MCKRKSCKKIVEISVIHGSYLLQVLCNYYHVCDGELMKYELSRIDQLSFCIIRFPLTSKTSTTFNKRINNGVSLVRLDVYSLKKMPENAMQ